MSRRVEEILAALSLEEKVLLLAGKDWWHTNPIERLGVGSLRLSDGPVGVRGPSWVGSTSVSFPCGAAIGATFDPASARLLAETLAEECREKEVDVLLGPTVNLQRHPLGGRHFECYSEDPALTADLAVAYIAALQESGVAATIKHLVANDTEFERHTVSSELDEATLRHCYLVPFEEAVEDAAPFAVMTSYNRVNGTYAAEHRPLIERLLREEWGFDGLVMSDWYGAQSTVASAQAGLDLEMPGPPAHYGEKLLAAVAAGEVAEQVVSERARAVLQLVERLGRLAPAARRQAPSTSREERREVARELARRSLVLLSNATTAGGGALLPLELQAGGSLAVIGPNAAGTVFQGGGSAGVQPSRVVSVLEGLRAAYAPRGVDVLHAPGCRNARRTPALAGPFEVEYFAGGLGGPRLGLEETPAQPLSWSGPPVAGALAEGPFGVRCRTLLTPADEGLHRLSLSQVGTARLLFDGELLLEGSAERGKRFHGLASTELSAEVALEAGRSYEVVAEYESVAGLPVAGFFVGHEPPLAPDDELLAAAVAAARRADAVVCVVGTSAEWETEGEDRTRLALPGRQDELVRAVLAANPRTAVVLNTGSPVSLDWAEEAGAVLQAWFGGEMTGAAVADVVTGAAEPGGRLPHTVPIRIEDTPAHPYYPGSYGRSPYGEGVLVGYRHYLARATAPRYWFGHGLSYTSFELEGAELALSAEAVTCRATIANTGARPGTAVLQAYVSPAEPAPGEAPLVFLRAVRCQIAPGLSAEAVIGVPRSRLRRLGLRGTQLLAVGWSADPGGLRPVGEISCEA